MNEELVARRAQAPAQLSTGQRRGCGGAPAAGWHPLRTVPEPYMDAKGQVVAKNHDDLVG